MTRTLPANVKIVWLAALVYAVSPLDLDPLLPITDAIFLGVAALNHVRASRRRSTKTTR